MSVDPPFRRINADPPVFFARELSSTSDFLKDRVGAGDLPAWTAVVCGLQTRGRGRPGNRWTSRRGDLAMSQWLSAGTFPEPRSLPLSLRVAAACLDALDRLGLAGIGWKYPNDLWGTLRVPGMEPVSGKVGGILVETARSSGSDKTAGLSGWVAGIGLNLMSDPSGEVRGRLGIRELSGAGPLREGPVPGPLRISILLAGMVRKELLSSGPDEARFRLEARLLWKGDWVVGQEGKVPVVGRIAGLAPSGDLRLMDTSGREFFWGPNVRNLRRISGSGIGSG